MITSINGALLLVRKSLQPCERDHTKANNTEHNLWSLATTLLGFSGQTMKNWQLLADKFKLDQNDSDDRSLAFPCAHKAWHIDYVVFLSCSLCSKEERTKKTRKSLRYLFIRIRSNTFKLYC